MLSLPRSAFLTSVKGARLSAHSVSAAAAIDGIHQPEKHLVHSGKKVRSTATSFCSSSTPAANFGIRFAGLAQDGGDATS